LNQRVGIFDCNSNKCIAPFIFVLLQLPYINDKIVGEAWGAAQPNVSPKAVGRIKVPLPPMNLQKEFSARLDVVYATLKMRADAASLGQTMASSLIAKLLG
jgi:restriction endonuclease S subunit